MKLSMTDLKMIVEFLGDEKRRRSQHDGMWMSLIVFSTTAATNASFRNSTWFPLVATLVLVVTFAGSFYVERRRRAQHDWVAKVLKRLIDSDPEWKENADVVRLNPAAAMEKEMTDIVEKHRATVERLTAKRAEKS